MAAKVVGDLQHVEQASYFPQPACTSMHTSIRKAGSPAAGLKCGLKTNLSFPESAQIRLPHPQQITSIKVSL